MPSLSLGQSQQMRQTQALTQQMQQGLKLLQTPTTELAQLLRQTADINPALVLEDPAMVSIDAERETRDREEREGRGDDRDGAPDGETRELPENFGEDFGVLRDLGDDADDLYRDGDSNEYNPEADERRQFFLDSIPASTGSLQGHLLEQLDRRELPPADRELAERIVCSVNDDGFLEIPLAEFAQAAMRPLADAERVLGLVQSLSPAGVGARDLRECLLLQLRADDVPEDDPVVRLAADPKAFEMLENRRLAPIAARLGIREDEVAAALRRLASLDPAPGRAYSPDRTFFIRPDIVVREGEDGRFEAFLDESNLPRASVSNSFRRRLGKIRERLRGLSRSKSRAAAEGREARDWMERNLREADALVDGLRLRQQTLLRVAQSVVARQQGYFRDGRAALRPLKMAQVAQDVGVHETTVSRAVAGKWIRSPQGVEELRKLFAEGIATGDGESVATDRVRERLREIVAGEDPSAPLSDQALADRLKAEGLPIARRTVVKYRGMLGIPVAADRRR